MFDQGYYNYETPEQRELHKQLKKAKRTFQRLRAKRKRKRK